MPQSRRSFLGTLAAAIAAVPLGRSLLASWPPAPLAPDSPALQVDAVTAPQFVAVSAHSDVPLQRSLDGGPLQSVDNGDVLVVARPAWGERARVVTYRATDPRGRTETHSRSVPPVANPHYIDPAYQAWLDDATR